MSRQRLVELIAEYEEQEAPECAIATPKRYYEELAEEEFLAAGFDPASVPWPAVAVRAHELCEEEAQAWPDEPLSLAG